MRATEYEEAVYRDTGNVLVGWWVPSDCVGVSLLVSSYLPFLTRLLSSTGDSSTVRCLLTVSPTRDDGSGVEEMDGEWMEVSWAGGSALRTLGSLFARNGGCHLSPAAERKAFLPVEQRDVPYWGWYAEHVDEVSTFSSPQGLPDPLSELFPQWLLWVHRTLRGPRFDLAKVQQLAAAYTEQLSAVARAAASLRQVQEVSMALHILDCDVENPTLRPKQWVSPTSARSLQAPLAVLKHCAGSFVAVEDVDVAAINAACEALLEPLSIWAARMTPLWSLLPGVYERMGHQMSQGSFQNRLVKGSGHSVLYSKPLLIAPSEGLDDGVVEVVASQWEHVVGEPGRDVLVGFMAWPQRLNQIPMPSLKLFISTHLPAFARLLRRYQQQQGSSDAQHGGSLVFATFHVEQDPLHGQQVDINWRWLSSDTFRDFLHSERGTGCLAFYPSGSSGLTPHVFEEGLWTGSTDSERALQQWLLRPFHWPSLSDVIRFVHQHMKGGAFDLTAMLHLAQDSGAQRGSEAVQHFEELRMEWERAAYHHSRVLQSPLTSPGQDSDIGELLLYDPIRLEEVNVEKLRLRLRPFERRLAEVRPTLKAAEARLLEVEATRPVKGLPPRSALPQAPSTLPSLHRVQTHIASHYLCGAEPFHTHPGADGAQSQPVLRWSAADVLKVMDEAAYAQFHSVLGEHWRWPVLDSDDRMVISARMSVFHETTPPPSDRCLHWLVVFQLLYCAYGESSLSLEVVVVAPTTTLSSPQLLRVRGQSLLPRPLYELVMIPQSNWPAYQCPPSALLPTATTARVLVPLGPSSPHSEPGSAGSFPFGVDLRLSMSPPREYLDVEVGQDEAWYTARAVELFNPPQIQRAEVYEALMRDYRAQLLMEDGELCAALSRLLHLPPLQTLLAADDWHHRGPEVACELPSWNPTFQSIARCIEAGKVDDWVDLVATVGYRGNTHRRYWTSGCSPDGPARYWSRPRGIVTTV